MKIINKINKKIIWSIWIKLQDLQFENVNFYPSISKELLLQNISLARNYTDLTKKELGIILACRKFVLVYHDNTAYFDVTTYNFDVTMGSFDSADLVGIYTLDTLDKFLDLKNVGIYRDDGLIFIPNCNGRLTSKKQKEVFRVYMG